MRSFVLDTVAVLAVLFDPRQLTRLGRAIVELAQDYSAELVVPTFSLIELERELARRERMKPGAFDHSLAVILDRDYVRVEPLGVEQVRALPRLAGIPDLHDRIMAAHAMTNDAPLMTCDQAIRDSGLVETVW